MRDAAQAAAEAVAQVQTEPSGTVRLSCPVTLAQSSVGPLMPRFMARYPAVRVEMRVLNRPVDPVEEGVDLALRVRPEIEDSATLVAKTFGISRGILVGNPEQLRRQGPVLAPADLQKIDTVSMSTGDGRTNWRLEGPAGKVIVHTHTPRYVADDLLTLKFAVVQGTGASVLPDYMCRSELKSGALVEVLPGWGPAPGITHVDVPGPARAGAGGAPADRFPGRKPRQRRAARSRRLSRLCEKHHIQTSRYSFVIEAMLRRIAGSHPKPSTACVTKPTIVIVPGWRDSGPGHWQSLWAERMQGAVRVTQDDWITPSRAAWVGCARKAGAREPGPVVIAAHSLGCIATTHLSEAAAARISGALLVAPADPERRAVLSDFAPVPYARLPYRSIVVASSNDPFCPVRLAGAYARAWGSEFVRMQNAGHINIESGHGDWPLGLALLQSLTDEPTTLMDGRRNFEPLATL